MEIKKKILKLRKKFYDLKQPPKHGTTKLTNTFKKRVFKRTKFDYKFSCSLRLQLSLKKLT